MIDLPAALAPWAAELSLLSSDLALTLAPWVGRLALALGPMSETRTPDAVEPDGYSGLARRGSYERLVTAEWALADVFPDEFLRRAATGEHLFLDLARRGPRGARRSIAIVSAGPGQLGAPRLAHLAALIVLARRAASAGASFAWGLLEDADCALSPGLDARGIRRLLDGRTARSVGEAAFAGWREALGIDAGEPVDGWLVGAPEIARWARPASTSCLIVRDVLAPAARALDVEVIRRGPAAHVRLELPPPDVCVRLLRDPLTRGAGPRLAAIPAAAQRIRFVGRRLLVHHADRLSSWPIPSSPREPIGAPRTRWLGEGVVAVGIDGRTVMTVSIAATDPTRFWLHRASRVGAIPAVVPADLVDTLRVQVLGAAPLPIGSCGPVRLRPGRDDLIVAGPAGRIFLVTGIDGDGREPRTGNATPFAVGRPGAAVVASLLRSTDAFWVEWSRDGEVQLLCTSSTGTAVEWRATTEWVGDWTGRALFGHAESPRVSWGPVAVQAGPHHWLIAWHGGAFGARQVDEPVSGVAMDHDGDVSLLVRPSDRRLTWVSPKRRDELPQTNAPIVDAVASPSRPQVAWLTAGGEVVVYSMAQRAVLLRLVPGDAGLEVAR